MLMGTTSGLKNADAAIMAYTGYLLHVQLLGDGTNAASVILYDNASAASGTVLAKLQLDAGLTEVDLVLNHPVAALNGIYADVTGTGAEYIVGYARG